MISVLLAVIISSVVRVSVATLDDSIWSGLANGGSSSGYGYPSYGYGSQYFDHRIFGPQQSHIDNYYVQRGFPNLYTGRSNSFPHYYGSAHILNPSPIKYGSIDGDKHVYSPQSTVYEGYQRLTDSPYTVSTQYYVKPSYESVDIYSSSNDFTVPGQDVQQTVNPESDTQINSNNSKTLNDFSLAKNEESIKQNESSKIERELQLTYLGHVPTSSFRGGLKSTGVRTSLESGIHSEIPFYFLNFENVDSDTKKRISSPSIFVSPYRFNSDFPINYRSSNFGPSRPTVPTSPTKIVVKPPFMSNSRRSEEALYTVSDSGNNNYWNKGYLSPRSTSEYYLIDVQPVVKNTFQPLNTAGYRSSSDSVLSTVQPILPFTSLRPFSNGIHSNTHSSTGYMGEGEKFNKYEHQNYNSGYETHLPNGHAYSNVQTDKEVSVHKYENKGDHGFSSGTGYNSYGSPGIFG